MSEKKFTPYEAALEVLKKAQEVYNKHADLKKAEVCKEEMSVEQSVADIMSDKYGVDDVMAKLPKEKRAKVLASLREKDAKKAEFCKGWMEKAEKSEMDKCGEMEVVGKKEDLKKLMSTGSTASGSVATTGGPSISSQIGFGKSDKKEYSGAVGDVDPKIISDMKAKLSNSKKDKKLPEFLKKKNLKKADGAPQAPEAAAGSPSNSPQSPKMAAGGLPTIKKPEVK